MREMKDNILNFGILLIFILHDVVIKLNDAINERACVVSVSFF